MSENPLLYSSSKLSKPPALKPALSAALASLEVQLDQELALYRRTRTTYKAPIQTSMGSFVRSKPHEFIAITQTTPTPITEELVENANPFPQQLASSQIKTQTPPPPPIPETVPAINEPIAHREEQDLEPPVAVAVAENQADAAQNSSIVPRVKDSHQTQENGDRPGHESSRRSKQPDDYLESSEALLRSLSQEKPQTEKPKSQNSLLSPLGIGSILLLVATITLGLVVFKTNNVQLLTGELFGGAKSAQSDADDIVASEPQLTPIPKYPNLASDEFAQVKDPNDVVGLAPETTSTPTPATPTVQTDVPATTVGQVESISTPKPQPSPTPQNLDAIKPSANGFYRVIIDNRDGAYESVKKVVPDAYISGDGKSIYLGAFKSKADVEKHLRFLQNNGIQAQVQQP